MKKFKEEEVEIKKGQKIETLLPKSKKDIIIAGVMNNEYVSLDKKIEDECSLEFIQKKSKTGMKIYRRTVIYILGMAVEQISPKAKLNVNYQLPNEMYCTIDNVELNEEYIRKLEEKMKEIVGCNFPIEEIVMTRKEAKELYEKTKTSKGRLQFDLEDNEEIYMYKCGAHYNYFYDIIANKTGIIDVFEVDKYQEGIIVRFPDMENMKEVLPPSNSKKLEWGLEEYSDIYKILDLNKVYKINDLIKQKKYDEMILLAEGLHEKKITDIANKIKEEEEVKMILVAGPSSSGKTTFAKRLGIQLKLNGLKAVTISVDNYFVERDETPKDEKGEYDFEALEAIDLELFNSHLTKLLNGEEVEMPEFDFKQGKKTYNGNTIKLEPDEVLILEGIHCLNDQLTSSIPRQNKYKVYISALTVLHMDRFNRISTTDTRLIRRMVRDYQFRGYSSKVTLEKWPSVNRGEKKHIFPFQEQADSVFNTSLIYEISALKPIAEELLSQITKDQKEYREAKRILNILKYFRPIPSKYVPRNSLLKEFLGGGAFGE